MVNVDRIINAQREREGRPPLVQLQSVGRVEATRAGDLRPGMVTMWNFGGTAEVRKVEPIGKTGSMVAVTYYGQTARGEVGEYVRRHRVTFLVGTPKSRQPKPEPAPEPAPAVAAWDAEAITRDAEADPGMRGSDAWIAAQPAAIAEQEARTATTAAAVSTRLVELATAARNLAEAEGAHAREVATLDHLRNELAGWVEARAWSAPVLAGPWRTVEDTETGDRFVTRAEHEPVHLVALDDDGTDGDEDNDRRECDRCADLVSYLSSRDLCDGCEEEDDRNGRPLVDRMPAPTGGPVDPDAMRELGATAYPCRIEDAETLDRLGVRADVAGRVLDYLEMRNRQEVEDNAGGPFPRHRVFSVDQPARPGKYVRLVALDAFALAAGRGRTGSVLSFLETQTGRLRQADGWKRPGPRVLADLSTDAGAARLYGPNGRAQH